MSSKYSQKLKDPRWQRKRLEALQAANWACQDCKNTRKTLHVHHTRYAGEPWDVPLSSLEVLCEDCHEERHAPTKPLSIYFAGKIGKSDWRHEIIPNLRDAWFGEECQGGGDPESISPIIWREDGHTLKCVGPYFVGCDHGCYHGASTHGQLSDLSKFSEHCVVKSKETAHEWMRERKKIYQRCIGWLDFSDVIFAYIDDEGAYGTLCEISNFYQPIALCFSSTELFKAYWFAVLDLEHRRDASSLCIGVNGCAKSAFKKALPFFFKQEGATQ